MFSRMGFMSSEISKDSRNNSGGKKGNNSVYHVKLLNQLKGFFSGAHRILKSAGKELRCVKDFQKHWLIFFSEMHYYLAGLLGMINLLLGKFQHHNVLFAVIADFHNGSFLRGRK